MSDGAESKGTLLGVREGKKGSWSHGVTGFLMGKQRLGVGLREFEEGRHEEDQLGHSRYSLLDGVPGSPGALSHCCPLPQDQLTSS